ncbi:hypothetical protein SLA2020_372060 [Shorea laevis]
MAVGDGRQTSLCYDIWCGEMKFVDLGVQVAAWGPYLMVATWRNALGWNILNSFRGSHPQLAEQICQLQTQSGTDRVPLMQGKSGTFSVARCYDAIRNRGLRIQWHRQAWNRTIVPRLSFILWLAARGRLKTSEQLVRRGLTIDACVFCGRLMENIDHTSSFHVLIVKRFGA